ncbi:MAG: hypothetical protein HWN81_10175 [Candidatus Lokiarchaeota archaeon]|nr:hypothetical protein [Candidatus Lokiarchaeota archaeon]
MKEIGVIVNSLKDDINSYNMVNCLNKIAKDNKCCMFLLNNENHKLISEAKFSIFKGESLFHFTGSLVSTSLFNTQCCVNSLYAEKKYLYLNQLEWMHLENFNHDQLTNLFFNKEINIVSNSKSHDEIITKLFKRTIGTVYNWNPEDLLKVIE